MSIPSVCCAHVQRHKIRSLVFSLLCVLFNRIFSSNVMCCFSKRVSVFLLVNSRNRLPTWRPFFAVVGNEREIEVIVCNIDIYSQSEAAVKTLYCVFQFYNEDVNKRNWIKILHMRHPNQCVSK